MDPEPSFVFQGTVRAIGATNMPMVEVNDRTAIVRVDRVLRAPATMEGIAGREITVQLRQPADVGAVAIFSADGWLYGETMAVVESGNRRPSEERPMMPQAEAEALERETLIADRAARFRDGLRARATDAATVVVGRVIGIAETAAPTTGRVSEHDPQWTTATVEVREALKGRPPKTVDVLFANSQDVMWRQAPKLAVGQQAVLLLHRGAPELPAKRANAVLDELDVQPTAVVELVQDLLAQ